jgi:nondiscriminating glutamyl-tRNA synthetase
MTQVRVRFAPSPTGFLHIGGARTALINLAFSRSQNGTFVLRIEDTDVDRSTDASLESIIASLKWLGLDWDEGFEKGGAHGPYRQSECFGLYESQVQNLMKTGDAYHCYCSPDELKERRTRALKEGRPPGYDNRCRSLSSSQKETFVREGRRPVVRFRVQDSQAIVIEDMVRGRISFDPATISDFIIMRADKRPTFHFANVIDDLRMNITHVIRGEDHLPNTPRHALLFKALGSQPPRFAHLSLILGPDGARLSKRHGATAVEDFRRAGYLPDPIINWLALLGFAPSDGNEVFALDEYIRRFDLAALGKSAAIFDKSKLDWLNGTYLRNTLPQTLFELCKPFLSAAGYEISRYSDDSLYNIVDSIKGNLTVLPDCVKEASIYFQSIEQLLDPDAKAYLESDQLARKVISDFLDELKKLDSISPEDIARIGKTLQKSTGAKGKQLYMPIRIAITGKLHGPELARVLPTLGRNECASRCEGIKTLIWSAC